MERLGGVATLGLLNQEVFKIKDCEWKTKTPFASIRRIVQNDDKIYKIKPGLWALKAHKKELEEKGILVETEKNKNSQVLKEFNHSYYQGLLVSIGNMKHLQTFVPNQDKNKLFLNERLGNMRTLQELPKYSFEKFIDRSATIDVIWFNERNMPNSFFEVEHSTDIQNSLEKFNDLQDFYTQMYIVADEKRFAEYEKKLSYVSFAKMKKENRVRFLDYKNLEKQYNQAVELYSMKTVIL